MTPSVLWISPKWPLPANDGARVATSSLISALTELGQEIHLVALDSVNVDVEPATRELGVKSASVLKVPEKNRLNLLADPTLPITCQRFSNSQIRQALNLRIAKHTVCVLDGVHCAAPFFGLGKMRWDFPTRLIYRAHNVETQIWDEKTRSEKNLAFKGALFTQTALMRRFEGQVIRASHGVATVSQNDLKNFEENFNPAHMRWVPIGYDFGSEPSPPPADDKLNLLFLGRLDWKPNQEGLEWFLREVWPSVSTSREDLHLDIAGVGDSTWLHPLLENASNIEFHGKVDSVDPLYTKCHLTLAPIFFGSGTRVKVIESSRFGRACLGTAKGVEGVPLMAGETYLHAETAEQWIEALKTVQLDSCISMGKSAFQVVSDKFGKLEAGKEFSKLIDEVTKTNV